MMGLIHSIESSLINVGLNCALSGRGQRQRDVRIIHRTSRTSIDKLIAALRTARRERAEAIAERDELRLEVRRLRAIAVRAAAATRPSR